MSNRAIPLKSASASWQFRLGLVLLLCAHIVGCCVSLIYAADGFPAIVAFDKSHVFAAALGVLCFAFASVVFAITPFSFGYFVGFYFYTIVLGYLWLVNFSLLSYNHHLAVISICLSILAFFVPALFVTSPIKQRFELSIRSADVLSSSILIFAAATLAAGAAYNFAPVGLSEMYKFRAQLELPALLRYAIGITSNALLPFAFAWFGARKSFWHAGIALLLLVLFYPVALTKLTLFAPLWLLFLALLSTLVEARTAVVLSLFLPMSVGVAVLLLANSGAFPPEIGFLYFGTVNSRMVAVPSIALEVYNNFFATHPLTHFCQINLLKLFIPCPYQEQLSIVMLKAYGQGAFNASLFATEGIASVGLVLAPLSAFGCGLVIAFANRLSAGLPANFILLSGGLLPEVLLDVPLSTALVTGGAAILFVLWYITPRSLPNQSSPHRANEKIDRVSGG
jgi:hypothetical protein